MVDVVLVVTSVIFGALVILGSIYFVVYFQHPEDRNVAWFPKIITVWNTIVFKVFRFFHCL